MQWSIILALAFALVIAAFAVANMDTITVNFLFGEASIPLVLVIIGATLAGAIIIASFNVANQIASYRKIKKLEEEVETLEAQVVFLENKLKQDDGVDDELNGKSDERHDEMPNEGLNEKSNEKQNVKMDTSLDVNVDAAQGVDSWDNLEMDSGDKLDGWSQDTDMKQKRDNKNIIELEEESK
ncbi:LapA family protein [Desulfuribacillus alkaliarsenatis]|uniref:Lipopolysaccharide assembly protein A domain-containing protein n=1 Tax=Desulfuribacillus alkaliarsenatis TaxID=766136 RepID=A0A1E5G0G8_9FIRM|nr:lipopolysaccharide assembly protein LapA domain-containing protein [Desulfuribacillus alkaliarsenatis]OEF96335.1 hypothetical protein BHF68_09285 [Desulfuribacillus alkaliarsenatis]